MTESHLLTVAEVVRETDDACSVVFELTDEQRPVFGYTPGQFLTLAIPSDRTGLVARCYSLSSAPHESDTRLQVTVKKTADGFASHWVNDVLQPGDRVRVLPPSGIFTPKDIDADFLLFAGGSGITPVISIAKSALATGSGQVVLLYANRDERSVIFAEELSRLQQAHPDRLVVVHWLESVQGLPTMEQMKGFAAHYPTYDAFVCGPAPFMKGVTTALRELEFPRERRHQEKFASLGGNPFGDVAEVAQAQAEIDAAEHDPDDPAEETPTPAVSGPVVVQVDLDGEQHEYDDWDGRVPLLEFLESKGLKAPFSCRQGECSACAVRLLDGDLEMARNDVLDREDLEEGLRLACQSRALTEKVNISYS